MGRETRIEGTGQRALGRDEERGRRRASPPRSAAEDEGGIAASLTLYGKEQASIGRAGDNDLVLDDPQVSRRHAQVRWNGAQYLITDLNSTNGVYVNGERVREAPLLEGARVQIGRFRFLFVQGALRQQHDQIRLDAINITQEVGDHLLLLHDVAFSILPKEFVCIVGGSGAGKSTLLDAISGVRPASHGEVLVQRHGLLREHGRVPLPDRLRAAGRHRADVPDGRAGAHLRRPPPPAARHAARGDRRRASTGRWT